MKKLLKKYVLTGALCFSAFAALYAQNNTSSGTKTDSSQTDTEEKDIKFEVETDLSNSYLWRGIAFNQGAVLQPAATVSYKGMQATLWSNLSLYESDGNEKFRELDGYLSYEKELGNFYLQPQLNFYLCGQTLTGEAAFFFGYYLGNLGIYTEQSYDIIQNPGSIYIENGFNYDNKTDKQHLQLYLAHGIGNDLFNTYNIATPENDLPVSAYQLIKLDGSCRISFNSGLYLKPHFTCNYIFHQEARNFLNKNNFNIGLTTGFQL